MRAPRSSVYSCTVRRRNASFGYRKWSFVHPTTTYLQSAPSSHCVSGNMSAKRDDNTIQAFLVKLRAMLKMRAAREVDHKIVDDYNCSLV